MAQRRATACDSVIRPAGRGRQGRLTLSSSQLRAWLDTLHKSRWNQIHIQHWTRLESDCTGAVAQANAVYEVGYQGGGREGPADHDAHNGEENGLIIRPRK